MRILIVGGGIAGLTLAALLRQRGRQPQVVEKSDGYGGVGYVLGLWPGGSRVLKGLDLYPSLRAAGQPVLSYRPHDESGRLLRQFDFSAFTAEYGPALDVRRSELIDLLRRGCRDVDLRLGVTATGLRPEGDEVRADFSDGGGGTFDLVVGCDGLHSSVRQQVFGEVPLTYSGWTGWAWWLDPALAPADAITEYWGAGRFLGLYPAREALCCFCALPAPARSPDPPADRPARLRQAFAGMGGLVPQVLEQLPEGERVWHDDFTDVRMREWVRGRVVLIGDAAAAILPTAGIGASVAMESAAVLADELSRADAASVGQALRLFVRRRRRRVDTVQTTSRRLGRYGLVRSPILAFLRNQVTRWLGEEQLLGNLKRLLDEPI